jgi:periplasmic copper chaperone A
VKPILLLAALLTMSCSKEQAPKVEPKNMSEEAPRKGPPDVRVMSAWARATAPGQKSTAAYMAIRNPTWDTDWLVGVSAAPPAAASVHETTSANGVSGMRMIESLEIPAGGRVELRPMGPHIMVVGLTTPLREGTTLPLTLRFKNAGERKVEVPVVSAVSDGPH